MAAPDRIGPCLLEEALKLLLMSVFFQSLKKFKKMSELGTNMSV